MRLKIQMLASMSAAVLIACTMLNAAAASRAGPVQVVGFRGHFCMSMGPRGWAVIAENPQRVSFGADMVSGDGKAAAGYSIFGTAAPMPGYENPDRAVATNLSRFGTRVVQYGQRRQLDRNVFSVGYRTADSEGMAFYQVIPAPNGGYTVVLRTAYTAAGQWRMRGAEASAVARSLRCNVPSVPATPDPPSLNAKPKPSSSSSSEEGESDSLYNQWLDKEYFHNPVTGENFWVSPNTDYQQSGPQGPGYYANHGNDVIKLQSGYAQ